MEWVAYCTSCKKELFRAPNGNFVEASARNHVKDEQDHVVLVAYEVKAEGENLIVNGNTVETIVDLKKMETFCKELQFRVPVHHGDFIFSKEHKAIWWESENKHPKEEMLAVGEVIKERIKPYLLKNGYKAGEVSVLPDKSYFKIEPH